LGNDPSGLGDTCAFGGWVAFARRSARSTGFIAAVRVQSKTPTMSVPAKHWKTA